MSKATDVYNQTGVSEAPSLCGLGSGCLLAQRYRLESLLGWGGQAVVFTATDLQQRSQQNQLAIKITRTDLLPEAHQEAIRTLRWEARLLRKLNHPALPRLFKFHSDSSSTWLARDVISGTPLSSHTAGKQFDQNQVQDWALQLCDLLHYLHTQSPPIICSDLKPANLVLRPNGALALIDMGAALTYTRHPSRQPRPRYGTPGYAPPEQMGNWGNDERSDLFSLAVVCYELLLGHDPTAAPLQFDFHHLDTLAPRLAPALRWALALDPMRRAPTAVALRSILAPPVPAQSLPLDQEVSLINQGDLLNAAIHYPQLLENALKRGEIERWLARHPDGALGTLLHKLRAARRAATPRRRQLDSFFQALAPTEGSAMPHVTPNHLILGTIPLRHWRVWSRPYYLMIHNHARYPIRWELECPQQSDAMVRLLYDGRTLQRREGVLPPDAKERVAVVAMGKAGDCRGSIIFRSGAHRMALQWEGTAVAGLQIGTQFVSSLAEIDLTRQELIPALEDLLQQGIVARWLKSQKQYDLAEELEIARKQESLDALSIRLFVGRILHRVDPLRFPWLELILPDSFDLQMVAGAVTQRSFAVRNRGAHPCVIAWKSSLAWVRIDGTAQMVSPGDKLVTVVTLTPPSNLVRDQFAMMFELHAGHMTLPVTLQTQIKAEGWWRRALRRIGGR